MPKKKYFLTKNGIEKVKQELDILKRQKSGLLGGTGPRAFRFGEIEAEYFAFREDLGRAEERISELEDVLESYELIKSPSKKDQNKVNLGAVVLIEMNGADEEFKIVGTVESDPANNKISNESPIGKALLGAKVGEKIKIKTPVVNHIVRVLKIKYTP
ncbi:MAG: GreA/GreB family elongation factor [Candidatus Pacebacteria bacterium]|nr:GreA/GreB family elongation factor [Candidatus Paceibacterota bacterium]